MFPVHPFYSGIQEYYKALMPCVVREGLTNPTGHVYLPQVQGAKLHLKLHEMWLVKERKGAEKISKPWMLEAA